MAAATMPARMSPDRPGGTSPSRKPVAASWSLSIMRQDEFQIKSGMTVVHWQQGEPVFYRDAQSGRACKEPRRARPRIFGASNRWEQSDR